MRSAWPAVWQFVLRHHRFLLFWLRGADGTIGYVCKTAVLQQVHAVEGVRSSHVCRTFEVDNRGKVRCHHAAHIVAAVVVERLGHRTAVRFIDFAEMVLWIHDLIHPRVGLLLKIVVKVQRVNMSGLSNATRHREVALRGLLCWAFHYKENCSWKGANLPEIEKIERKAKANWKKEEESRGRCVGTSREMRRDERWKDKSRRRGSE